jgi:hypothetical protein
VYSGDRNFGEADHSNTVLLKPLLLAETFFRQKYFPEHHSFLRTGNISNIYIYDSNVLQLCTLIFMKNSLSKFDPLVFKYHPIFVV